MRSGVKKILFLVIAIWAYGFGTSVAEAEDKHHYQASLSKLKLLSGSSLMANTIIPAMILSPVYLPLELFG